MYFESVVTSALQTLFAVKHVTTVARDALALLCTFLDEKAFARALDL